MAQARMSDLIKSAEDAGFSNLPVGTYDAKVFAAEAAKTGTGKDQIKVKFEVIGGPHSGRKVPNNFVISPENANALGFFFRHMRALGLDSAYFAALDGAHPTMEAQWAKAASDLLGRECRIVVGEREWNGEKREDVKNIQPPLSGASAAPSVAPSPFAAPPVAAPMPAVAPLAAPSVPALAADPTAPKLPF